MIVIIIGTESLSYLCHMAHWLIFIIKMITAFIAKSAITLNLTFNFSIDMP